MIQTLKSGRAALSPLAIAVLTMNRVHTIGFHIIGKREEQPIPEINTISSLGTLISALPIALVLIWNNPHNQDTNGLPDRRKIFGCILLILHRAIQ